MNFLNKQLMFLIPLVTAGYLKDQNQDYWYMALFLLILPLFELINDLRTGDTK